MTSDRPPPRRVASDDEDGAPAPPPNASIAEELLRRHGRSPQPSSARLIALLKATLDVLASRGLSATPGALFAALMPALETELQSGAQMDEKTLAALLALLDAVLPRVPEPILVSRFAGAARILSAAVRATTTTAAADENDASSASASAARHAVAALATATAAAAPSVVAAADWPGVPAPAFALLLQMSLDARPKVRRAAASGVVRGLAGLRRGALSGDGTSKSSLARLPASAPYPSAAEAVMALARAVLPAPTAAARAAASAPANAAAARSAADAAVRRSVLDCLHCLSLLREAAGLLPAASVAALPPLIAPLFELGSSVLTRAAGDALSSLASVEQHQHLQQASASASSSRAASSSASLVSLVRSLAASPGAWSDGRDAVATASVCGALASAMRALRSADAAAAAAELPGAISALCGPLTAAGSADGARGAAAAALLAVVEGSAPAACACAAAAAAAASGRSGRKPLAVRAAAALAAALSPRSRAGWALALPAAAAFLAAASGEVGEAAEAVSSPASEAAALLLERVGELVAGANDAAERGDGGGDGEEDGERGLDFAAPAAAALGRALRSLGPHFVLGVLPLNIIEALDGEGGSGDSARNVFEPRTWMLPLLRQHASGGSLRFWGDAVLPLARACGDRAGAAAASGDAQRAMACRALEAQAWATLPTFACWALDGGDALSTHAQAIARAFSAREDLRAPICAALTRLCDQALEISREGAVAGSDDDDNDDNGDDEEVALSDDESDDGSGAGGSESESGDDSDNDSDLDAAAASTPIAAASSSRPAAYTPATAAATLAVLRSQAKNWLPLLLNAFVSSPPSARAPAAAAIASLSSSPLCAPRRAVEAMFGSALTKLAAATRDAAADPPVPNGKASDGGETPGERRATFLGAALALSSGLSSAAAAGDDCDVGGGDSSPPCVGGIDALWDAAVDAAGDREQAVQKSAYRVLAALLSRERRSGSSSSSSRSGKKKRSKRGGKKSRTSSPWLDANLDRVLSDLLSGAPAALPAAKRHRLAAVREAVRAARKQRGGLRTTASGGGGGRIGGDDGDSDDGDEEQADPVAALVAEAVLCVKEPNRRTRAAAYELLVDLGRPSSSSSSSFASSGSASTPLADLVALICGGLAAGAGSADWGGAVAADASYAPPTPTPLGPASPHVASAAVMALARLLHAYPSELAFAGARLLPAVLPLLRTRSRELVKAVLGFAKVAASRLPVAELLGDDDDDDGDGGGGGGDVEMGGGAAPSLLASSSGPLRNSVSSCQKRQRNHPRLRQLLEALLVWSDDPKNKFRLRVRLVVERLVRRLGAGAVGSAMPPGDARLLSHIRKAEARKARRRGGRSRAGDEDEDEGDGEDDDGLLFDDTASRRGGAAASKSGRGAKTAGARSEWAHTAVFGAATTRRDAASTKAGGGGRRGGGLGGARLPGDGGGRGDPLDLLGAGAARALAAAPRGGSGRGGSRRSSRASDDADDDESRPLPLAPDGRLVINAEEAAAGNGKTSKKRKAAAEDGYDSGDSDFDDVRGAAVDARAAWRATAGARSLASGAAKSAARSVAAKSSGGRSARTDATRKTSSASHSAERFRASKGGASGDVVKNKKGSKGKGGSNAVEPYAYWPLDRKMLNRRPTKARVAAGGLEKVVAAGRAGAKAAARDAKRRRK